jgi:hypothetical protein
MISTFVLKRYYYFFTHGNYESDKGIIFESITKWSFYEYSRTISDFVDSEKQSYYSSSTIMEINFTCSNINKTYRREYNKITNFFGLVSGIFSFLSIISQIICNYFYEKLFVLNFSNLFVKDRNALFRKFNNNFNSKKLLDLEKNNIKNEKLSSDSSTIKTSSKLTKNLMNNQKMDKNLIKQNNIEIEKNETERKSERSKDTKNNNKKIKISKNNNFNILRYNKKDYLKFFKLYLYKYMSLELIIPTLEKLNCKDYNVKHIFNHRASNRIYVRNSGLFLENLKNG